MLTPFPGTVDFARWGKSIAQDDPKIGGVSISRHWLIPAECRPKIFPVHPTMSSDEIRQRTQEVWDKFYSLKQIWKRSGCARSVRGRLAFLLISKLDRQMYANTGIATDSARIARSTRCARWLARPCRLLFAARPMPKLTVPLETLGARPSENEYDSRRGHEDGRQIACFAKHRLTSRDLMLGFHAYVIAPRLYADM
jgi:hypothetical protein